MFYMEDSSELNGRIIVGIVAVLVLVFFFFFADAATEQAVVGTLSIAAVPNEGGGQEQVIISYDRPSSTADLTGWRISNGSRVLYTFDGLLLTAGEPVVVCAESVSEKNEPGCTTHYWVGDDQLLDAFGKLVLENNRKEQVAELVYTNPSPGQFVYGTANYVAEVYARGEKVLGCMEEAGRLKVEQITVQELLSFSEVLQHNDRSVVAGFYYTARDGEVKYFPGLHWPAQRSLLESRCKSVK
jgi:hypothetical protein